MQIGWGMPAWSAEMDSGGGKMETRITGSLLPLPFIDAAYGMSKRGSEFGEYYYEGGSEKKRRLSVEQVRSLESSFERENKLEPEKKLQLAQKLGLEPRQVSVWFQNRRARSKSKRLELSFDSLKANYDSVAAEVDKLRFEVARLNALLRAKNDEDSATGKPPVMATAVLEESSYMPIAADMAEIEQGSPLGTATSDYSATNQWFPCGSTLLDEHHNNTSPSDVTDCAAAVATMYDVASSPDIRADENSPCRSNSTGYNNIAFAQDSFSEFLSNELWLW